MCSESDLREVDNTVFDHTSTSSIQQVCASMLPESKIVNALYFHREGVRGVEINVVYAP